MMNPIVEVDGHVINLMHLIHADPATNVISIDPKDVLKSVTEKALWLSYDNGDRIEIKGDKTVDEVLSQIRMRGAML
jgi:hypothetical protein